MLLYHQHASVKDERHPHVDEKSPGHSECTSLTQYVCITHAIQVLARWLVMSAIPAVAACVLPSCVARLSLHSRHRGVGSEKQVYM